ncbi:Lrp/AsnC family transcriptional regulator, leucine-responsive regulatory protein [Cytobacillus horneckiae]|uniref:Lrp/AsnC family transcriptional regulator n=1 Tax=Cytobacillus horneckiae TaxID=549687 RepID=A0A2N0ZEQ6_9BACI|nr:Lrp/AsnC family transcriptional regulator [Cytobacillus horneckiae]NRG44954.1 Lrp/AsnC family transcriptional regulator [Bacillus sp. CRN 9]MBN6889431.1 Lrp/AsnC family transcriptional regulator [Cytobacillus horneckiae]MCM3176882.1 Lrp/AsnC family transcriptional regulator [Cytobacillus horneckiae]MEC1156726.1 Lrp/AsnC family transcriptional regulator [Cytobacillus horneckiae]MED2939053.1 Lrp/AsnC family transcriptional regulator [Cytobacillus horneckiae]
MDEIDREILTILQNDGRISFAELGRQIKLSTPAVKERVKKLEDKNVIEAYRAVINPQKVNKQITAFVLVDTHQCEAFRSFCNEHPAVIECHRLAGQYSYLVKVVTHSVVDLEGFIDATMQYGKPSTLINLSSPVAFKQI